MIQVENAKTSGQGVTKDWLIDGLKYAADHEIDGYASATSVGRGETIRFYVHTVDPTYKMSIYRIGWYGGIGGRLMQPEITKPGVKQSTCPVVDASSLLVECSWAVSNTLTVPRKTTDPTDWASGNYLVKLTGSSGKQSYIHFVVRDDTRPADLMMQAAVTTYQAYNSWGQEPLVAGTNPTYGGKSLYPGISSYGVAARKVSFNRPYANSYASLGAGQFFAWEIRMLRFLEREGYDVVYSTNLDTHVNGTQIKQHKSFLSVGHDEYWSKAMRNAVEAARDAKVNLGFFGANAAYWQVRFEPSGTGEANRTLVGYKNLTLDPEPVLAEKTVKFRDIQINRPEAALIGVMFDYNPVAPPKDMVISQCLTWVCSGTNLTTGSVLKGMLGYEVDRADASSPANLHIIASSPYVATNGGITETRYSNMSYYLAPSGAGVFATGSMNWNFGLDNFRPIIDAPQNSTVERITRNVLNAFVSPAGPPAVTAMSIEALSPVVESGPASTINGGGCAFSAGKAQHSDFGLVLLLASNLIWRRRAKFQN